MAENLHNPAVVRTVGAIRHLSFLAGEGRNTRDFPHWVERPRGTDVWIFEFGVSGRGLIRHGGRESAIVPGDAVLFQPGIRQDYGMDPALGEWYHQWICFTPRPHWLEWLRWPERAPGIRAVHLADPAARERVRGLLDEANQVFHSLRPRREDFAMNAVEAVLLWCDLANPANAEAQLSAPVRAALTYLCEHLGAPASLARLARIAGLSRSRLSHAFREQVGVSPLKYVENRRLAQARELLLMTALPVAEVAARVGYANPFYFTRVFTRQTGVSPTGFRRQGRLPPAVAGNGTKAGKTVDDRGHSG